MADAADSKSAAPCGRVGSTPISGTKRSTPFALREGAMPPSPPDPERSRGYIFFLPWTTSTRAAILSEPFST
jgi:hypothetical protein